MTDVLGYVIGFILPPIIDLVNVRVKNDKVKFWVAMLVSVLVGVLFNLDKFGNPSELLGALAVVFTESQIVYKQYWEKSEARVELQKRI